MVINYVWIESGEITVGFTDEERCRREIEDGRESGVDTKTHAGVTLEDRGPGIATGESVHLFATREDPLRASVIAAIGPLLEVAWTIRDQAWDLGTARRVWMGTTLRTR